MPAIQAEFVNFKNVPTRKVAQVILEVPQERFREVLDILGLPTSEGSIWVGVARLDPKAAEGMRHEN